MAKKINEVSLSLFFLIVLYCPHFNEAATNMLCVVPERSRSSATVLLNGGISCPGTTILKANIHYTTFHATSCMQPVARN